MNQKSFLLSFIFFLLFFVSSAVAQEKIKERLADDYFNKYSFVDAVPIYEDLAIKSPNNIHYVSRTAECYRLIGNTVKAEEWYAKLVNMENVNPEDILRYAEMLEENKKYDEAQKYYAVYYEKNSTDSRGKRKMTDSEQLNQLNKDSAKYIITNLPFNSAKSDFGLFPFRANNFLFSSNRENEKERYMQHTYNWNNQPFLDLYTVEKNNDSSYTSPQTFSSEVNSQYHEGPIFVDTQTNMFYLTRNNFNEKKTQKSKDGINKLKLYIGNIDSLSLKKSFIEFPYNNNEYSVGHATLNSDGSKMYFSSDMPGGFGGADIYVSVKENGIWGQPINLGNIVNTEGNEMFPFFSNDNTLYFSSNGHAGLGGLDIYSVEIKNSGISNIKNIGSPINSNKDDFSFYIYSDNESGYFSSNREGGKGDDDIYAFYILKPVMKTIKGVVKDKNGNLLEGIFVKLMNDSDKIIVTVLTGEDGSYSFIVDTDQNFKIKGTKEKYNDGTNEVSTFGADFVSIADITLEEKPGFSLYGLITEKGTGKTLEEVSVKLTNNKTGKEELKTTTTATGDFRKELTENKLNDTISYDITIEKKGYLSKTLRYDQVLVNEGQYSVHELLNVSLDKIDVGADLSKLIDIKPIYFDLGKYNIRKDAAIELDKIVKVMNENIEMVIELGSHTDCRGSAASNEKLSDNRAKESANYIKKRISNPDRIYGKGYGESKLINDCACEGAIKTTCTEEEHQKNRRTEFIIIKM